MEHVGVNKNRNKNRNLNENEWFGIFPLLHLILLFFCGFLDVALEFRWEWNREKRVKNAFVIVRPIYSAIYISQFGYLLCFAVVAFSLNRMKIISRTVFFHFLSLYHFRKKKSAEKKWRKRRNVSKKNRKMDWKFSLQQNIVGWFDRNSSFFIANNRFWSVEWALNSPQQMATTEKVCSICEMFHLQWSCQFYQLTQTNRMGQVKMNRNESSSFSMGFVFTLNGTKCKRKKIFFFSMFECLSSFCRQHCAASDWWMNAFYIVWRVLISLKMIRNFLVRKMWKTIFGFFLPVICIRMKLALLQCIFVLCDKLKWQIFLSFSQSVVVCESTFQIHIFALVRSRKRPHRSFGKHIIHVILFVFFINILYAVEVDNASGQRQQRWQQLWQRQWKHFCCNDARFFVPSLSVSTLSR